jgi:hypothetical protein
MPEPRDEEFKVALQASVEEHMERRATTKVEVMRLRRFLWRYRFYWGRHVANPKAPVVTWHDYESGVRFTRQWALVAGAWHLSKLQVKDARKWETPDGD